LVKPAPKPGEVVTIVPATETTPEYAHSDLMLSAYGPQWDDQPLERVIALAEHHGVRWIMRNPIPGTRWAGVQVYDKIDGVWVGRIALAEGYVTDPVKRVDLDPEWQGQVDDSHAFAQRPISINTAYKVAK
jgi:hypothetical protein